MTETQPNRIWRERAGVTLFVVGVPIVLGAVFWLMWSRPRFSDERDGATCAAFYREARTAADTARVDHVWPGGRSTKLEHSTPALRCGALRAAGRVPA